MTRLRAGARLVTGIGMLAAATVVATPGGTVRAADGEPPLRLIRQSFVVPGVDDATGISLTIAGEALGPPNCTTDSDTIRVVSYSPVRTRAEATAAVADPGSEVDSATFDLCEMERLQNGSLRFDVPTYIDEPPEPPEPAADDATDDDAPDVEAGSLQLPDPGVIPIGVEVRRAGDVDGSFVTFVDRLDTGTDADDAVDDRMQVAAAFVVDGGPTLQADGTRSISAADRAAVRDALALVGASGDAPIALGVRPELVQGMYASPADREAFDELATALASDRVSLLSVPYVAVDPSAAATSGAGQLFKDQMREGEDVFRQLMPGARTQRALWLFDEPVSAEGAELLRGSGAQLAALLPPQAFSLAPSDRQFEIDYGDGSLPATPVDAQIAAALAEPGPDPVLTATHLAVQVLLTRQQALDDDFGPVPMVEHNMILSTATGRIGNVDTTATLLRLLAEAPELALVAAPAVTSKSIADQAGQPYRVAPPDTEIASLTGTVGALSAASATTEAVSSMLPAGDTRPTAWRQQLAVAASSALDADARTAHVATVQRSADAIRGAIVPLRPSRFTLGGRHSTIRLTLTNTGPDDLTVRVIISSSKLEIADEDADQLVQLPAGESQEVKVPVEARSNGEFPVDIEIVTPADAQVAITEPVSLSARVNALAGLGQLATGAFLLVLLSWWVQHLRKRRRAAGSPAAA